MSSSQSEKGTMVFTRQKKKKKKTNDTSNKKPERCFFTCEKNDTSNQKPQRCVTFAPKLPPFIGACSLQRHFADIQREKFFSKCFSRKKCEKYLGNGSGIGLFCCQGRILQRADKTTVEGEKLKGDVSLSCAFCRSYFVFYF